MEHDQHWRIEVISPEKSPEPPPNSVYFPPRKCVICYRPAYCKNYGTLTCDACKMFFRRVVTEKLEYECSNENSCYSDFTETSEICPKCKSCRYQRCLAFGMRYVIKQSKKQILELKMRKEMEMVGIIGILLYQDSHRSNVMASCFTGKNPSLEEMIKKKDLNVYTKTKNQFLRPQDWSFFALYTTVDFLLNLDFMQELETSEKLILLKHSASKCSLFGGAMRTYRGKRDRMITVDGQDIYPDEMKKILENEEGADDFLNRIRSFVVSKLVELSVTTEEYILICVILFCDPALFYEPDNFHARSIVSSQQQKYTDTLFQYCIHTYQQNGPSRFADLLSLCPIIQRNFEDLQYLTMVFKLSWKGVPIQFKTIVEELV
ncbi:hypothetical protein L5515_007157 [Caenorhabditis briggsae]|uniref:Uncharacterized protein n=1 Tax=Caenorhabditis briggsae TaxID=6238 RepID=A0AAE9JLU1_CAEBR|nr:hypothetical protein L5515_007157 [Caenorhabditis briggsae]